MRFIWIFLLIVGLAQAAENRVALIVGNASYASSPLINPVNDARAMNTKLRSLGFKTVLRENLTQKQIGPALREFRANLTPGSEALFFYAGHGLQIKGVNYLPAVDADISAEEDVPTQSIDVNKILEIMEASKTRLNLVFLDACRNNPYSRSFRSQEGGLAKMNAPSGTIISFATRPGSVAADGEGSNGLYTEHLLKAIDEAGAPIEQVLKKVLVAVKKASRGKQEPWLEGGIEGEFYFIGSAQIKSQVAPPAASVDPITIELAFWESIKSSQDLGDFEEYLRQYPQGRFAGLAKNRLKSTATVVKSVEMEKRQSVGGGVSKNTTTTFDSPMVEKVHSSAKVSSGSDSGASTNAISRDDERLASGLVGKWEGAWVSNNHDVPMMNLSALAGNRQLKGKVVAVINSADGIDVKGRANWFSTSVGDLELDFMLAKVKGGRLFVDHPYGFSFEVSISADGKSMSGVYSNRQGGSGTLEISRVN